nr:uncharacterized protein LOC107418748 isoform X4 [Ziziphus jujuba var. spinosa]
MNGSGSKIKTCSSSIGKQQWVLKLQPSSCFPPLFPSGLLQIHLKHPSDPQISLSNFHPNPRKPNLLRFHRARTWATLDEKNPSVTTPLVVQEPQSKIEVEESVKVLKNAAKRRKLWLRRLYQPCLSSRRRNSTARSFFKHLVVKSLQEELGCSFLQKKLKGGRYFPLTAVQRFDAAAKRIENGVYHGPIGALKFEGRFSWKNRVLSFIFECIRIKIGPLKPLEISLGQKDDRDQSWPKRSFLYLVLYR